MNMIPLVHLKILSISGSLCFCCEKRIAFLQTMPAQAVGHEDERAIGGALRCPVCCQVVDHVARVIGMSILGCHAFGDQVGIVAVGQDACAKIQLGCEQGLRPRMRLTMAVHVRWRSPVRPWMKQMSIIASGQSCHTCTPYGGAGAHRTSSVTQTQEK